MIIIIIILFNIITRFIIIFIISENLVVKVKTQSPWWVNTALELTKKIFFELFVVS